MTTSWSNLPRELWAIIFKHVQQTPNALTQCRLVCKAWNPRAEQALFDHVNLKNEQSVIKFCDRLHKNPALGLCVHCLSWSCSLENVPLLIQEELFKRAITPNIRSLEGTLDKSSASRLLKIVQASGKRFDKLVSLNISSAATKEMYPDLVLFFKKSLQELDIEFKGSDASSSSYHSIVQHLQEFGNLKCLGLTIGALLEQYTLLELETALQKCHHLKSIHIWLEVERVVWNNDYFSKEWILHNVQQCLTVDSFSGDVWHPVLLEYLTYKYPNLNSAIIFFTAMVAVENTAECISNSLKRIPNVKVYMLQLNNLQCSKDIFSALKSNMNRVHIDRYRPSMDSNPSSMIFEITKNKASDETTFTISLPKNAVPQFFNDMGVIMGSLSNLCIEYGDDSLLHIEDSEEISSFSKLLAFISVASHVKFFGARVAVPQPPVQNLVSHSLQQLEICGALIDEEALTFFSQVAPNLKQLILNTCILDAMCPQNHQIHMPFSDLDTLSIVIQHGSPEEDCGYGDVEEIDLSDERLTAFESIRNSISVGKKQIVSVVVSNLSSKQTQHFVLRPGTPAIIKAITQQDYMMIIARLSSNIIVQCKSLKTLQLDLGELTVELKLDADRQIESMDDWVHDHRLAFLQKLYPSQ